jgi:hypothetical protein
VKGALDGSGAARRRFAPQHGNRALQLVQWHLTAPELVDETPEGALQRAGQTAALFLDGLQERAGPMLPANLVLDDRGQCQNELRSPRLPRALGDWRHH